MTGKRSVIRIQVLHGVERRNVLHHFYLTKVLSVSKTNICTSALQNDSSGTTLQTRHFCSSLSHGTSTTSSLVVVIIIELNAQLCPSRTLPVAVLSPSLS